MKEATERLIHLEYLPSEIFRSFLDFTFGKAFQPVPEDSLTEHVEVASYLLADPYLDQTLQQLQGVLTPQNCLSYLEFANSIACQEMLHAICRYLSANLFELAAVIGQLEAKVREQLVAWRHVRDGELCILKKENLGPTSHDTSTSSRVRFLYRLSSDGDGKASWCRGAKLPFSANKWNFSTAVLHNYLFVMGGYKRRVNKSFEFKMASFRYNPVTDKWQPVAPLMKRRRHFSTAVAEGYIFAIGGWYLDSLLAPDSRTSLYTAVERYNPWSDTWTFVSPLPLTDFSFSVSLSHDIPLCAVQSGFLYVIGNVQRTREKLILQYNIKTDCWTELLPTLTRTDANIPSIYFFSAAERLYLIGGNNRENIVTSFCTETRRWGEVHAVPKVCLAGQGTLIDQHVYMPAPELNMVIKLGLHTLTLTPLLPLPFPASYEVLFELSFPPEPYTNAVSPDTL
ncbi:kelch repeat and BTB domain-containing protein 11 isoform X2 [Latimeria chalumnae]|nr:PREDICTED: kelch repeat and BTB domain-containing protein 11-like isoform X2 [Latimeria chalumnae]|eukprot:XP_006008230.1 PREDICTED: kelch repeat and BTB domain-containing protein 11-like isoform X2 [Latimeria chalumnae]